jgi:hypothetical protein
MNLAGGARKKEVNFLILSFWRVLNRIKILPFSERFLSKWKSRPCKMNKRPKVYYREAKLAKPSALLVASSNSS